MLVGAGRLELASAGMAAVTADVRSTQGSGATCKRRISPHKVDIGGGRIDDLIAEVDAGLASYERMLVRFKNEIAAAVMAANADAE